MFGSSPKPQVTYQPTPVPTVEDATVKADQDAEDLRKRRGRASTVLSSTNDNAPETAAKQLLG